MSETLADALRGRSAASLSALFEARPDLTQPLPHDLSEVAARITTHASIRLCLDRLNARQVIVLETLVASTDPSSTAEIADLLGRAHGQPAPDTAEIETTCAELDELALIWRSRDRWRVPRAVRLEFGAHPLGLAPATSPAAQDLPDPAARSADQLRILRRLAAGPPVGTVRQVDPDSAVAALLADDLLVALDAQTVQIPRRVALQLRADQPRKLAAATPPRYAAPTRRAAVADQAGLGTAVELLGDVEAVLDEVDSDPPTLLRDGGVGARDLTRIARHLGRDRTRTGFLLELTRSCALTVTAGGRCDLTTAADQWFTASLAQRWAVLVTGWRHSRSWWPSAETTDRHPWADPGPEHDPRRVRGWFVRLLAEQVHQGVDLAQLGDLIAWHRPRLQRDLVLLPHLAQEADWLGLTALGAVTDMMALAGGSSEEVATAAADRFPEPVSEVIVQADLTAVAPGPLAHEVGRTLRQIADVESRGGATVFRFTRQSIQRAFDAGWNGTDLLAWVARHATTELPQPLHFLVGDVARRHGQIKVGTTSSWIRLDDPAHLVLALGDAGAARLGVTQIADTILVAEAEADEVVAWLRELGLAPASDLIAPRPHRAPTPAPPRADVEPAPPPSLAETLLKRARGVERAASIPHRLREARDRGQRIEVSYVASDGSRRHTEAVPAQVSDGSVRLLGAGAELSIPLARVLAIHDVE